MRIKTLSILVPLLLAPAALLAQPWGGPAGIGIRVSGEGGHATGAAVRLSWAGSTTPAGPPVVTTDSRGRAEIGGLAEGEWRLVVSLAGYMEFHATVALQRGKKAEILLAAHQATGSGTDTLKVKTFKVSSVAAPVGAPVARRPLTPPPTTPVPAVPETSTESTSAESAPRDPTPEQRPSPPAQPTRIALPPVPAADEPAGISAAETTAPSPAPEPEAEPEPPMMSAPEPPDPDPEPQRPPPAEKAPTAVPAPAPEPTTELKPMPALPPEPTPAPEPKPEPPASVEAELEAEAPESAPAPLAEPEPMPEPRAPTPAEEPESPIAPAPAPEVAPPVHAAPATTEPLPEPAPVPAQVEPEPMPEPEPAPESTASQIPPPPAPAPVADGPAASPAPPAAPEPDVMVSYRSHGGRTCPDCKPTEWGLTAVAAVGVGDGASACNDAVKAVGGVIAALDELGGAAHAFAGDLLVAAPATPEPLRTALKPLALTGACRVFPLLLPENATFRGFRFQATDLHGGSDCLPGQDCPIGDARWPDPPGMAKTAGGTFLWAVFENDGAMERQAGFTAYFVPLRTGWRPPQ